MNNKELVLFICHIINDESVFRFKEIYNGAKENGFDCKFTIDISNKININLTNTVDLELFTFKNDENDLFFQEKCLYKNTKSYLIWQYNLHTKILFDILSSNILDKYYKIWLIEYDCCFFGHWKDFFEKYKIIDVDYHIIGDKIIIFNENYKWGHIPCKNTIMQIKQDNLTMAKNLICCSRFSKNAIKLIYNFYEKYGGNHDLFYEFVFPTACINANLKYHNDIMPSFRWFPEYSIENSNLLKDTLIHPIKLNSKYSELLSKYII